MSDPDQAYSAVYLFSSLVGTWKTSCSAVEGVVYPATTVGKWSKQG